MIADTEVTRFFRQVEITRDLRGEELELLMRAMERRDFQADEVLLREEEVSHSLYFLSRGEVDVLKRDEGRLVPIGALQPGAPFGEMSFMDAQPASATVRARTPGSLWVLNRHRLGAMGAEVAPVQHALTHNIARTVIQRLRDINASYVERVSSERTQARLRDQFGQFFVMTIILFGIGTLIPRFISTHLPPLQQMSWSWGFLALIMAPILSFVRQQRMPLAELGITVRDWRTALREGLQISALVVAVGSAARWLGSSGDDFVTWGSLAQYSPLEFKIFMALYLPHCFLQEVVARGVIQGSLARLMDRSHALVPALIASALFGIFHLYVSFTFALITFAVSLGLGVVYNRHRSLLGVTLIHYILGTVSLAYGFN